MKAAIYLRVSTLEQASEEATSLDMQEERCRAYAAAQGWDVVEVYREEGFTGTKPFRDRPVGSLVLADAALGKFERLVTYNISRFGRSVRWFIEDTSELEDLGVYYASVSEQFDTATAIGRMVRVLLVSFAEFEAEQIKERMASGKLGGLKKGRWSVGPMTHGYRWVKGNADGDNGRAEIVEEEAEVVRRIFELVASGLSAHKTADRLNAEGYISPRGKAWTSTSILRMVEKPGYKGDGFESSAAGETFTIPAPGIIEPEVWDRASRVLDQIRSDQLRARDGRVYPYAMSGRVYHEHGGEARMMNGKTRNNGSGVKVRSYRCLEHGDECPGFSDDKQRKVSLEAGPVEAVVLLSAIGWIADPDATAKLLAQSDARSGDDATLARTQERLADLAERRAGLGRLLADGTLSEDDVRAEAARLDSQIAALEETRSRLTEPEEVERRYSITLGNIVSEVSLGKDGPDLVKLADEAKSVVDRFRERIGKHGPGKPPALDLSDDAVKWASELVRLFDVRVTVGEYQEPGTWTVASEFGLAFEPVGNNGTHTTSSKKVVRDRYADLLMERHG